MLQDCIFPQHCKAIILQLIFLKILSLSLDFSTLIIIYLTLHFYRFISLRFIQPLELSKFVYFPTLGISRGIISSNHFLEWHLFPLLLRFHDKNARVLLWASQEAQMVKKSACNAGDQGLIPGLGGSPGEGHGNPLQYSCLENPMDRGAWGATVHEVAKCWAWLSD